MHRVDTEDHDDGLFQDGTPQIGQGGTILSEDWMNDLQENICNVIEEGGGLELEKGDYEQLRLAIAAMISAAAVDWTATIDGARVKPGVIEMFGASAAPAGYLECDGSVVLRADWPALFTAIGTTHNTGGETGLQFRLPDLRGEFVRGWDDARGVDAGRAFGSAQAQSFPVPALTSAGPGTGGLRYDPNEDGSDADMSVSSGGQPVTPRNVALLFIIKT